MLLQNPPDLPEWAKTLIAALSGVVTGALLEPLKQWITLRNTTRRAHKAIYKELGQNFAICKMIAKAKDTNPDNFSTLAFHDFDFYFGQHREAFNLLSDKSGIIGAYRYQKSFSDHVLKQQVAGFAAAELIVKDLEGRFEAKALDKRLVEKYSAQYEKSIHRYGNH